MQKTLRATVLPLLAAVALTSLPAVSHADLAFNVGAVSDYRFRGISQTRKKPTLQGGVDYSLGGFYVGAWGSGIKWIKDAGGDASVEIDIYGGYKGDIVKGLAYDVGVLTYQYPSNKLKPNANTTEIYGALTFGQGTIKYSNTVTNAFGATDSKNSFYLEAGLPIEVGYGITVTPHLGYQRIRGPLRAPASYKDYSVTAAKDFSGFTLSLAVVGTDASKSFYSSAKNGKELGKATVVVGAKYNF